MNRLRLNGQMDAMNTLLRSTAHSHPALVLHLIEQFRQNHQTAYFKAFEGIAHANEYISAFTDQITEIERVCQVRLSNAQSSLPS